MKYNKVLKDIYSAWLGKNIGIRYGAPVENWTHENIKNTYGYIDHYVCDYEPCFASDDDANGPFYFVKALDYNCSSDISESELSKQILNILCEGHGFFWWGGKGIATEHTAYLNLLEGMDAPLSGSAKVNGTMLAEQIGGQIFSDCWGYVSYDDPVLASKLAGKMASAMHDLDGIEGAKYVAACISLAFTIKDAYEVVLKALEYINPNSSYAKLVLEIVDLYKHNYSQDQCLQYILNNHGYDKYPGVCHILPNTAIMIMALLYGENNFTKTMNILCNAGWDTDCTLGNVGSIMGALVGVENIDPYWIVPIKDRFIGSSLIGSWNIDTLSRQAHYFCELAFKLKGLNCKRTNKNEISFDLPYGIQGFECNSNRYFESNLIQKNHTLTCVINNAFKDNILKIYKKTYYRPIDLYDVRYQPSFSPIIYPNETITFELNDYENLEIRPYAIGKNHSYYGDWTKETNISFKIDAIEDCILEIGLEIKALTRIMHNQLQIKHVRFDQNCNCKIDFRKEEMNDYGLDFGELPFKEINQCTTLRQNSYVDENGLHIKNDMVVFGNADAYFKNIEFEAKLNQKLEIGFGCCGRLNYTCVVLDNSEISLKLYKNDRKGFTIDKKICKIKLDNFNYVKLAYDDSKLFLNVNNQEFIFDCIVEKGALVFNAYDDANITWCQFAMTNSHI